MQRGQKGWGKCLMSSHLNLTREQINTLYPICGMTVYSRALVLKRFSRDPKKPLSHVHLRGQVSHLSSRSRTNFVLTVMRSPDKYNSLLTLSYGQNYPRDGKTVKNDLKAFLTAMRREFGPLRYFWFLEFQERGAPHFHVGLNIGPPMDEDRSIMADIWARIAEPYDFLYCPWKPGRKPKKLFYGISTRDAVRAVHEYHETWEEFREVDGAIRYIVSYATKPHQKTVPVGFQNVGRFWGVSRQRGLEEGLTVGGNEEQVREVLKELGRDFDGWELLPRVIFIK